MKCPRFSIGKMMVLVGLIALNLGASRMLCSAEPSLLAGFIPAGLALQFGAYRLIRSRTRARAFWAGFLAAGLLAGSTLAWTMIFRTSVNIGLNGVTGQSVKIIIPGFPSADRLWSVWERYFDLATSPMERVPFTAGVLEREDASTAILIATIVFLPQLLLALTGGLLAVLLARLVGLRPGDRTEVGASLLNQQARSGNGGDPDLLELTDESRERGVTAVGGKPHDGRPLENSAHRAPRRGFGCTSLLLSRLDFSAAAARK
jgi:hypothetical protein